jgi:hypothetical protein
VDAGFLEPALDDLRAQAATEAIQVAVGVGLGERRPGLQALRFHRAVDQLVAKGDGGGLALLLVAGADLLPLLVGHQRQVDHAREGAFVEFDRGAHVHHRHVVEEQLFQVGAVGAHQITSTAWLCRSTSSPIGASAAQLGGHGQELGFAFRADRHQQATAGLRVAQQVLLIVAQAPILCP